jgi:hypothetical protein
VCDDFASLRRAGLLSTSLRLCASFPPGRSRSSSAPNGVLKTVVPKSAAPPGTRPKERKPFGSRCACVPGQGNVSIQETRRISHRSLVSAAQRFEPVSDRGIGTPLAHIEIFDQGSREWHGGPTSSSVLRRRRDDRRLGLLAPVAGQVALAVSLQIQPADPTTATHRGFPDRGVNARPFHAMSRGRPTFTDSSRAMSRPALARHYGAAGARSRRCAGRTASSIARLRSGPWGMTS